MELSPPLLSAGKAFEASDNVGLILPKHPAVIRLVNSSRRRACSVNRVNSPGWELPQLLLLPVDVVMHLLLEGHCCLDSLWLQIQFAVLL